MARPLRIDYPGAWHHVTARGIDRRPIFFSDEDRRHWLELMPEFVETYRLRLHAYVLMDNHYHLLLETPETNLSRALQWLQTSYSMWFNRKHGRVGPLFQGRFKAIVVDAPAWGLVVSRYVHLNPVRVRVLDLDKQARAADRMGMGGKPDKALIQERLEYLRAFRWSSFRAYAGWERPPAWLTCQRVLEIGGGKATNPFEQYRDYVEAAVREGLPPSPWEQLVGQLVLGSREFLAQIAQNLGGAGREQPQLKRVRGRPDWQRVVAAIELVRGLTWQDMCRRRGDWGRDLAWYFGRTECGLSLQALGEAAGGVDYSAVSAAVVRLKRKLVHDSELAQQARLVNERIWLES